MYGNYDLKLAIVAQLGLGARPPEDGIFPLNIADDTGKSLDGVNKNALPLETGQIPPTIGVPGPTSRAPRFLFGRYRVREFPARHHKLFGRSVDVPARVRSVTAEIDAAPARRNSRAYRACSLIGAAALAAGLSLVLAGCGTGAPPAQSNVAQAPGTVELNKSPPNDVPPGGGGTGTVFFHGTLYRFAIGGLGVEGSAVAIIQTSGEIYQLQEIARFPGTYRQSPSAAISAGQSSGGLWLQNEHATIMHLDVPPQGRLPDLAGDALRVVLDQ